MATQTYMGSIDLLRVKDGQDGKDAKGYNIVTSQEEILIFATLSENGTTNYLLSPDSFTAEIKDSVNTDVDLDLSLDNFFIRYTYQSSWYNATIVQDAQPATTESEEKEETFSVKANITLSNKTATIKIAMDNVFETILELSYKIDENLTITKHIPCRVGLGTEMAKLKLAADGIAMSVNNSALTFNANGLTVNNGGIKIKKDGKDVVSFNSSGNLEIRGDIYADNGHFSGTIEVEDSIFKGRITAESGTIGGFDISEGVLSSQSKNDKNESNIVLNGEDGKVIANNIELGTGATITDYIKLGEKVILRTPTGDDKTFIKVVEETGITLDINSDGEIRVGSGEKQIILDGQSGEIKTRSFINSLGYRGWSISSADSIFNNIVVRGSIKAATLEYGEVQTIGGMLLVRPSSMVKSAYQLDDDLGTKYYNLVLESITGFRKEDICLLTGEGVSKYYFKIIEIVDELKTIKVESLENESLDLNSLSGKPIVDMGNPNYQESTETTESTETVESSETTEDSFDSIGSNTIGIGINGSISDAMITPQSISVFEFTEDEEQNFSMIPHIVLGKLPNKPDIYGYAAGTYGLYAENVLLKGSLVTEDKNGIYSGISTIHTNGTAAVSEKLKYYMGDDFEPSEILIWAGAKSSEISDIQNSTFFVDKKGYIYAGGGYFDGTIITNSTIAASTLKTAKIIGTGDSPALEIQDASKGIRFLSNGENVFELNNDKMWTAQIKLDFNGLAIDENGHISSPELIAKSTDDTSISITTEGISFLQNNEIASSIEMGNKTLSLKTTSEAIVIDSTAVTVKRKLYLEEGKEIYYGSVGQYKPVINDDKEFIGYDLYITE